MFDANLLRPIGPKLYLSVLNLHTQRAYACLTVAAPSGRVTSASTIALLKLSISLRQHQAAGHSELCKNRVCMCIAEHVLLTHYAHAQNNIRLELNRSASWCYTVIRNQSSSLSQHGARYPTSGPDPCIPHLSLCCAYQVQKVTQREKKENLEISSNCASLSHFPN